MRLGWAFFFALACGGHTPQSNHYHLVISPDFSSAQSAAIFDAATEWQTRSGGFVSFDGGASFVTIHVDVATSAQLTAEFGGGTIGLDTPQGQSSHIEILEGLDDQTFRQTALHELGHAIGLVHMTPGNVMCADTVCATLDVRCGDLEQLTGHPVTGCIP